MSKEPIKEFKTLEAALMSLSEWQHRLYLDDWIVKLLIVDGTEIQGLSGRTEIEHTNRCAVIKLAKITEDNQTRIAKVYQEHILVHELLHLKYNFIEGGAYEMRMLDIIEHAMLEQMARSLIMAKYSLDPEWFKNF